MLGTVISLLPVLFSALKDIGPAIEGAESIIGAIRIAAPHILPLVHDIAKVVPKQAATEEAHLEEVAKSLTRGSWTVPFAPHEMSREDEERWFDRASGQI